MDKELTYKVKCRQCGKISELWFGTTKTTSLKDFQAWAREHCSFPIEKQCHCDNGSMMFHDLISYSPFF